MTFQERLIETVRIDAEVRARGRLYWLRRRRARPLSLLAPIEGRRGARFSRAAIMSAVSESAERFSEQERFEFETDGRLPEWFWTWVEERARWWDDTAVR